MATLTVAAVAWKLRPCASVDDWLDHLSELVTSVSDRANVVVLPELVCLELLWGKGDVSGDEVCHLSARAFDDWVSKSQDLAVRLNLRLVAGSVIAAESGGFVNRSVVAEPDGNVWFQDKLVLTQFEQTDWNLKPGFGQTVRSGLGVKVCYDSEFSRLWEPLSDQDADVVAVPTFTETPHGQHRVQTCSAARATEFQVVVALAPLQGSLGREPVPETKGTPMVWGPSVPPFPAEGLLARGQSMAIARFDPEELRKARNEGDVRNAHDQWLLRTETLQKAAGV